MILFCFNSCHETIEEGSVVILNPLDDDPTAVGNFATSKFDGIWEVTNNKVDWNKPPILTFPPMLYIFRENTFQQVSGKRQVYNNDEILEMERSWAAFELMYSNRAIYFKPVNELVWKKMNYKMSADGNNMLLGNYRLIKLNVKWTKEDIINSSWEYYDPLYDIIDDDVMDLYTFSENTLLIQLYINGICISEYDAIITIELTDNTFTIKQNVDDIEYEHTFYYYIINDKLIFSTGEVLSCYVQ
jgi:hypothetical protein